MLDDDSVRVAAKLLMTAFSSTVDGKVNELGNTLAKAGVLGLRQAVLGLGPSFAVDFGIAVVRALVRNHGEMSKLTANVERLVREPTETAIAVLRTAEATVARNEIEKAHVESRYREALIHLGRARSLADPDEKPFLRFLMGSVCLRVAGGGPEASIHLRDFAAELSRRVESDLASIPPLSRDAKQWEDEASQIRPSASGYFAGSGLVMWEDTMKVYRRNFLLMQSQVNQTRVEELRRRSEEMKEALDAANLVADSWG